MIKSEMELLVFILVIFILIYMYNTHAHISTFDMIFILVGLLFLVYAASMKKSVEGFIEIGDMKPIRKEEDISIMTSQNPDLLVYLTSLNKSSYPDNSQEWLNVVDKTNEPECSKVNNKIFKFSHTPVFSRKNGLLLGTNRIYGPLSNTLGISLQSTFTIFFACKHGDFINNEKEIELLKLYGNSNDNNGIALFIRQKSVKLQSGHQFGNLSMKYVDDPNIAVCKYKGSSLVPFDNSTISFYFIIKDVDKIRILYINGSSLEIYVLGEINIKETNATFSNKEMVINRFENWKASLFQYGILGTSIGDNQVLAIKKHIYSEYLKATSTEFGELSKTYNEMLDMLKNFTKCPYDETVCKSCASVGKWNDITEIASAPPECREAIDKFCKANPKHGMCRCWDVNFNAYGSDSCKMVRNMFNPQAKLFDNMSVADLNYIKDKYNIVSKSDCPKPSQVKCLSEESNTKNSNTYMEYDYEKLKINPKFLQDTSSKTIISPHAHDVVVDKETAIGKERGKEVVKSKEQLTFWQKLFGSPSTEEKQNTPDPYDTKLVNPYQASGSSEEPSTFSNKLFTMFMPS
jgi:hypothetical protein